MQLSSFRTNTILKNHENVSSWIMKTCNDQQILSFYLEQYFFSSGELPPRVTSRSLCINEKRKLWVENLPSDYSLVFFLVYSGSCLTIFCYFSLIWKKIIAIWNLLRLAKSSSLCLCSLACRRSWWEQATWLPWRCAVIR